MKPGKFTGTDILGNNYDLNPVSEWKLQKHALGCGDSLVMTFPHVCTQQELETVRVLDDSGELIFQGNVDEQSAEYSPEGIIGKIRARGTAAVLEDNEAVPASYAYQSPSTVYMRHALIYGMSGFTGANNTLPGEFRVLVGDSEWNAIIKFCRALNGWYPRIDGTKIDFGPFAALPALVFSNTSADASKIKYARAAIRSDRKKYISSVLTRPLASEEFTVSFTNAYGANRRIRRRRVMRYRDMNQTQKQQQAKYYMDKARAGSSSVVLMLDGHTDIPLRSPASFEDTLLGTRTGYGVAGVTYYADNFCERTEVELWPVEDLL